jgi:low temperature requirement protein LtrA
VLAAGVSRAFEDHEFLAVWLGYVIMRLALIVQWLRVARSTEGAERTMALRYVFGVLLCQVGWLGLLVLPEGGRAWVFLVMAVLEMCVPPFAERDHPRLRGRLNSSGVRPAPRSGSWVWR